MKYYIVKGPGYQCGFSSKAKAYKMSAKLNKEYEGTRWGNVGYWVKAVEFDHKPNLFFFCAAY